MSPSIEVSEMPETIVVTGATGHVGSVLVERLLARGSKVRAVARTAEKLAPVGARGAEARPGSLGDERFLTEALRGAAAAFVMIPPAYGVPDNIAYQRATADTIARALEAAGVRRVATLSSVGAEKPEGNGLIKGLHYMERRLEAVPGLAVVHLRAGYFMENHVASIGLIKATGINGGSLKADLPMATIAARDVGSAAAEVLARDESGRSVRYLLGPRDYTQAEATRILGQAVGRPDLPYVEFPYDQTRQALLGAGFSPDAAALMVEMQQGFNEGRIRPEPRTPQNSTPTTLETFAREVFAPAFGA